MKRHFYKYIVSALVLVGVSSCDVTDLQPVNVLSESVAFSTPELVNSSVVGAYDAAQSGFYNDNEAQDRGYIWGAAHIELGEMRGENMVLINVFYDLIYRSTQTTTAPNVRNYWENGFRIINLSNLVREGVAKAVENGVIDKKTGDMYTGEMLVLRAMTYHNLVIHFSRPYVDGAGSHPGLPIHTTGINSAETVASIPETHRSTVKEIYDFVLKDLDDAESLLPEENTVDKVTRASKGAAIALKTRVYLHMENWAKVIEEGNKLIVDGVGGYELGESVDTPWANNRSSESIFSMEMSANDALDVNSALANMLGSPNATDGARGEVAISPIMWNQTWWDADDLRRTSLMVHTDGIRKFTHKYRDYVLKTDFAPVIRYAEVILNVAEAESRGGDANRAITLANMTRDRAISGAMTSWTAGDFSTGDERTLAIIHERTIELLAEGERWSDITRLSQSQFSIGGIPAKMNSADAKADAYVIGKTDIVLGIPAIPYDDNRYLWPIPQSETTRNPTLAAEQNPGF